MATTLTAPAVNGKQRVRAVIIDDPQAGKIVSYPLEDLERFDEQEELNAAFNTASVAARSMAASAEALTESINGLRNDIASINRRLDESH